MANLRCHACGRDIGPYRYIGPDDQRDCNCAEPEPLFLEHGVWKPWRNWWDRHRHMRQDV